MKQKIIIALIIASMPIVAMAQDDMYFVPSKKKAKAKTELPRPTYYSGSNRDIDEYNRQGNYYHEIDSAGNDIISFDGVTGTYPDSISTGDYALTRQMSRFDDYHWDAAYREGYSDALSDTWSWSWHSPWYYDRWLYDPYYYGYGWNYGWNWSWSWHNHWYYPNYGYHRPPLHFYPSYGTSYRPYRGITGTRNSGRAFGSNRGNSFKKETGSSSGNRNNGSFRSNKTSNAMRDQATNGSFGNERRGSFNSNNSTFNRNSNGNSFNSGGSGSSFNRGGSSSGGSRSGSPGGGSSFRGRK